MTDANDRQLEVKSMTRLRELGRVMDELIEIPILGWRVGLDGLLGLIPGIGDFAGFLVSAYVVFVAARLRVSKTVLVRMTVNVLLDFALGAIPFLGDLFDFAWKANRRNIRLLESYLADPRATRTRSTWFLAFLTVSGIATAIGLIWLLTLLLERLRHALSASV